MKEHINNNTTSNIRVKESPDRVARRAAAKPVEPRGRFVFACYTAGNFEDRTSRCDFVVDIREKAWSRDPKFTGESMGKRYGFRYVPMPELGIKADLAPATLVKSWTGGIKRLVKCYEKGYTVCVTCASMSHLKVVASLLLKAIPRAEVYFNFDFDGNNGRVRVLKRFEPLEPDDFREALDKLVDKRNNPLGFRRRPDITKADF